MNVVLLGSNCVKLQFFLAVLPLPKLIWNSSENKTAWRSHLSPKKTGLLKVVLILSRVSTWLWSCVFYLSYLIQNISCLSQVRSTHKEYFLSLEKLFSKVNSFSARGLKLPWAVAPSLNEVYSFFEGKLYVNTKNSSCFCSCFNKTLFYYLNDWG